MQNSSLLVEIDRMVTERELPKDNRNNHLFVDHLRFNSEDAPYEPFSALLESMLDDVVPITRKSLRGDYRACGEQLLLNLSRVSLAHSWLCIDGDRNHYKGDPKEVFPRFRLIDNWLKYLLKRELIAKLQGKNYKKDSVLNRYFPISHLHRQLVPFSLWLEAPIRPPYLRLNKPDESFIGYGWEENDQNEEFLKRYNRFAKKQQWALKAPTLQVFTNTKSMNGRLHTAFQSLPSRDYKIRINTKINGNQIAEVDFNANHLRLFLAKSGQPYIGDDPYSDIADEVGCKRHHVKGFINTALNNKEYSGALGASLGSWGVPYRISKKILAVLTNRYPNLNFFCGFGLEAMNKEGEILMNVMTKGMDAGIFCLPIHDAIAVEAQHAEWAKEAMLQAWSEEVNDGIWCIHNATTVVDIKYGGSK